MLISTVGGLQQDVARKLGTVSSNTGFADKCLEWINAGIDDMTDTFPDAPWKQVSAVLSLVTGFGHYKTSAIDADLTEVKSVMISAMNIAPRFVPPDQFFAQHADPSTTGIPSVFTLYGNEIIFDVLPNIDVGANIYYLKNAAYVSAASAVPPIPTRFLQGLALYCQLQGLYDREDYTEAAQIETKYTAYKANVRKRIKRRVLQQRRMISSRELQQNNRGYNDRISNMFFND